MRLTFTTLAPARARALAAAACAAAALALTGCGLATGTAADKLPASVPGTAIHGSVYGGQQPVVGSTIQLYAVGSGSYGAASTPLIASTIKTVAGGVFDVSGAYTCPTPSTPVYIVATGGDAGFTANNRIALMAALGPCSAQASATVVINEATTAASVTALAPFMTGLANIGAPASNLTGLTNAMADVNLLVDVAAGASPGPLAYTISGVTVPTPTIFLLANILAACVNTGGGNYNDGSACGTLFFNANPGGTSGTAPTETLTAMMNIAHFPQMNVTNLRNLSSPVSPFQPTSSPTDFTLAVSFTTASSVNSGLAADAAGNIFIANKATGTLTELTHTGAPATGSPFTASLSTPSAVAVDPADGTIWLTNQGNNSVSRLSISGGVATTTATYVGGTYNLPSAIAFDSANTAWVANRGNHSVSSITNSGTEANYVPANLQAPVAIAVTPR